MTPLILVHLDRLGVHQLNVHRHIQLFCKTLHGTVNVVSVTCGEQNSTLIAPQMLIEYVNIL